MAVCTICNTKFSFLENVTNRSIQRCKDCDQRLKQFTQTTSEKIEVTWQQRGIFPGLEQEILRQLGELKMPSDLGTPIVSRLRYLRGLTDIRYGNVPRISTTALLNSDEYAHFEWRVIYF